VRLILLFIFFVFSSSLQGKEGDEIIWYSYQSSPAYILDGPDKHKGFVDLIRNQIINELPQYTHNHRQVTIGRMLYDMQLGKNVCFPSLIKTPERELFATFSNYSIMQYSLQLIINKELAQKLALSKEVDIRDLLVTYKLIGAIMAGRSYTQNIDELFLSLESQIVNLATDSNIELFQLLIKNRVDFILEYPSVANYVLQQYGKEKEYVTLKIKGVDEFVFSSVACSNNQWGEKVISDVNKVLKNLRTQSDYFNALTAWLGEEKQGEHFKKVYHAFSESTNEPFAY